MQSAARPSPLALAAGGAACLAGAMGIGRFIYTPLLPVMAEALSLSKTQAGLLASANFVGYLAGALLAAMLRLPGSARAQLLAALALGVVTTMAMGLTETFALFVLLRFAGGLASAVVLVCASSLVVERLALMRRPGLSSLHFAGVGVGIVLSALLVLVLPHDGAGWRAMWLAGGGVYAAAMLLAAWLIPPAQPGWAARPLETAPVQRVPAALILSYGLFGFGYVTTATFIVAIVRAGEGARSLEAMVWMAVGLAGMPSVALWSAVARWIGVLRAYAVALLAEAVGVLASVAAGTAGLVVAALLLGGTIMGITALGLVAARAFAPAHQQRAFGFMTAAFGVGQIVGPLIAGTAFDATGSFLLPSIAAAALLLLGAVMVSGLRDPPTLR